MTDPKRIAIFRMGHIGDMVVAMPALWTVRRRFPSAHIVFMNQEHEKGKLAQGLELLPRGSLYDSNFAYRLGAGGVSKLDIVKALVSLRLMRIDMLVYIPSDRTPAQVKRDRIFFRLAGIKRIVGMRGILDFSKPVASPLPFLKHEADILLEHLARDGVKTDDPRGSLMHLGISEEERAWAKAWLKEQGHDGSRPLVGMGPGTKMPAKLWPLERFVHVAQRLDEAYEPTLLLVGSGPERGLCDTVAAAVRHPIVSAGDLTVRQSAAVIERCDLYVGNDTGTTHMAAAVGVRCVAVYAARAYPGNWYPYGKGHTVFRIPVPCEGCELEVCDRDNLCTLMIGQDEVAAAATKTLGQVLAARAG